MLQLWQPAVYDAQCLQVVASIPIVFAHNSRFSSSEGFSSFALSYAKTVK
jgi:hypothetical protein